MIVAGSPSRRPNGDTIQTAGRRELVLGERLDRLSRQAQRAQLGDELGVNAGADVAQAVHAIPQRCRDGSSRARYRCSGSFGILGAGAGDVAQVPDVSASRSLNL